MKRSIALLLAFSTGSAAMAHGSATGGALAGATHPLLGFDHLLMLIAVGTAAASISSQLLLWALGGAVVGAAVGFSGFQLGSAELLAALAISVLAGISLLSWRFPTNFSANKISGIVVAAAVSIHAMLHGLEAPKDNTSLIWWSAALFSSAVIAGGTYLLLKKSAIAYRKTAAITLLVLGGALSFVL
ncbi:HupE/UreJ family protein [Synechococcus sp. UW140]|uniref:HupE/UreJ family protein n=1 Tax=Synechococcus sp. UW140 TaxID=368503 RepID=UPI003137EBE0